VRIGHLTGRQIQLFILGMSLVAFAGAFLSVGLPRHISPIEPVRSAPVRLMRFKPAATNDPRYVLAELLDPSLLSLPSAHGFSGKPWERAPAVRYEPSDFLASAATLTQSPPAARPVLQEQTPLPAQIQAGAERVAPVTEFSNETAVAVALNQSVFRITGELEARTLIRAPALGLIEAAVPLRPAVVRIGVGADGRVRYATLERTCGDTTVNAQAVALAREFRFEPRAQATLTPTVEWGLVKFLWAFAAPAAP